MGYFHRAGKTEIILAIVLLSCTTAFMVYQPSWWIVLLFLVCLFFLVFSLQFFRYPNRPLPATSPFELVSPADGKLVANEILEDGQRQLSIFMSPLNVHANWVPIAGKVVKSTYVPGKYLVAWHPKSSTENERHEVVIEVIENQMITIKQIAGAVARRVRCYLHLDTEVKQGDELGFIKFGSRVDVLLPQDATVNVKIGDKVKGNTTIIATLPIR